MKKKIHKEIIRCLVVDFASGLIKFDFIMQIGSDLRKTKKKEAVQ